MAGRNKPGLVVIEEYPALLEGLVFALQDDFQVHPFRDGFAFLAAARRPEADAVVLDLSRRVNDSRLLAALSARMPEVPVLILAEDLDAKNRCLIAELGIRACMCGVFDLREIRREIYGLLRTI